MYSVGTLDTRTIHVLWGAEQEGAKVHHTAQNGGQFKTYTLVISRIFHWIFLDCSKPRITETTETEVSCGGRGRNCIVHSKSSLNIVNRFLETVTWSAMTYQRTSSTLRELMSLRQKLSSYVKFLITRTSSNFWINTPNTSNVKHWSKYELYIHLREIN